MKPGEISPFTDGKTKVQKGEVRGPRSHSKSADLEPQPRTLIPRVCLFLVLHHSTLNTHSSTFRSRESHHTSLTTSTRGTCRSRTSILTSGTLRIGGTKEVVRTEVGRQDGGRGSRGRNTYRGASFAIRTRASRAASQTLRGGRGVSRGEGER